MREDALRRDLSARLAAAQREFRIPSASAAVFERGQVLWQEAIGLADVERGEPATPAHRYRIGSITKTFTAAAVLQLRDAGLLDLGDELRRHVPEAPPGPTVRQCLAHLAGLQREPPGEVWETLVHPDRAGLLAVLEDAESVLAAGERWHYSNLVFGLLGELVERLGGRPYADHLREHVLAPLGLDETRFADDPPAAQGYFVQPYSDGVSREAHVVVPDTGAAMGQLWSTSGDLARWATFLARGDDAVLPKRTMDEMAVVQTLSDHVTWTVAWGLGLELYRRGERVLAGHGGAMPGFLACVCVDRKRETGAVLLTSSGAETPVEKLALDLACAALDALPERVELWRPDAGAPADVQPLLGRWWSEGHELVVRVRDGRLQVLAVGYPAGRDTSYLEREGDDRYRIVEGRELGELVRVVRDASGVVVRLYLATYPLTREPVVFGESR